MIELLKQIYLTLDAIEVKGKENVEKLFCAMVAIEQLIVSSENRNTEEADNGG